MLINFGLRIADCGFKIAEFQRNFSPFEESVPGTREGQGDVKSIE